MASVKLLLKESIKHVGRVGDVVEVSPGYARNYLIPHDLAVEPTPGNMKKIEERKKEIEKIERKRRDEQAALIKRLEGVEVTLEAPRQRAGSPVRLRQRHRDRQGAQGQGFNVEPDDINLLGKLDRIDKYMVRVSFAEDLATEVKV